MLLTDCEESVMCLVKCFFLRLFLGFRELLYRSVKIDNKVPPH